MKADAIDLRALLKAAVTPPTPVLTCPAYLIIIGDVQLAMLILSLDNCTICVLIDIYSPSPSPIND